MTRSVKNSDVRSGGGGHDRTGGTTRAEQARATRRRIIDAATQLFLTHGYAATMLDQVARESGVAVQTVYFHFGNKRTLLKEALDIAAVGDDEPVALLDRPWVERLRTQSDPATMISLWVAGGRSILERIGPIMRVVRDAAGTDPDLATQWSTNQQQTRTAHRLLAQLLADRDVLKPGMTVEEAADVVFTLQSIEVYWLLTTTCGWTVSRWETWTTAMACTALLRQDHT
jgi:AcrR family transcriptional regulator